jgi:hypothetical protein
MKYRIVKRYYLDNTSYYIVQQKNIFGWGVPKHSVLRRLGFAITTAYMDYMKFKSVEEAEDAVKIATLSYELKDQVIKEL